MITKKVLVTQVVEVTVDEKKFTPAFYAEFLRYMYPWTDLDDHIRHLGQLHARGIAGDHSFIEGYGKAKDFGMKFSVLPSETEIEIVD